jgi:hypothetical protein
MVRHVLEEFTDYIESRDYILAFLLTLLFLFFSFVGYTRFAVTEIVDKWGTSHSIHISYYGFPFEMVGILNPIGTMENYYLKISDISLVRILWNGLFLNFIIYFLLAFILVYAFRRLTG